MNKSAIASLAVTGILTVVALNSGLIKAHDGKQHQKAEVLSIEKTPPAQEIKNPEKSMQRWYEGTLNYYDIEGGFFGFTSKEGEHLLPMGLEKKYHQPGAKLKLYGYIDNNVATIQMWGKPFKVMKVEVIKKGASTHPSQM
ncbi:hypothetical protein FE810_16385 [Thalassotalea litorea]|uniref:Uncharacterized protein n=1 Tax=Thalassotalea litorea TaxID=2020715 RepID=A0A5R9ILV1_9GAMM|nr:hypothetical protein [Thalassotalea litorea]TLU59999.1 hypothetical protein FE810_16385 [Thalassotalea litorea]